MVISLEPNSTGQTRTASIEIVSGSDKITITVTQEETMQPGGFVIEATNVMDAPNDMASVIAISYGVEVENQNEAAFASAKYENNGFMLNLPATVPSKFLLTWTYDYFSDEVVPSSDKNAKIAYVHLYGRDHNEEWIAQIIPVDDREWSIVATYIYADRDFTAKGKVSSKTEFDCSFKKGWNIMYYILKDDEESLEVIVTTQKPANANLLKWICIDA